MSAAGRSPPAPAGLPLERLRARAFRQTAVQVPGCLPPNQPAPHAGRFHRRGEPWPLYAALDTETMWAEWSRATSGAVDRDGEERVVCTLDVDLRVLDLRVSATRAALGVTLDELIGPWSPAAPNRACLAVATAARQAGADGFVVPSAT
ncbi:MAG: RES domain-containing protein, partial [Chloroflexi bacterium]